MINRSFTTLQIAGYEFIHNWETPWFKNFPRPFEIIRFKRGMIILCAEYPAFVRSVTTLGALIAERGEVTNKNWN